MPQAGTLSQRAVPSLNSMSARHAWRDPQDRHAPHVYPVLPATLGDAHYAHLDLLAGRAAQHRPYLAAVQNQAPQRRHVTTVGAGALGAGHLNGKDLASTPAAALPSKRKDSSLISLMLYLLLRWARSARS